MNPIFKKSFVSGLLKETLRSGVIAALVMMPFGLFFKKMGLRMNEYGPKTIQLIFGDLQPGPQITFGIIEHFLISWMVAVPLLLVLLWTFKRISALLVGSLYGIVFYVIMNSLALPWFFGDPTPWQLGFETIYPSLLVHTIYGLSVALTSRAFVVRWTGQTRFSFTSH